MLIYYFGGIFKICLFAIKTTKINHAFEVYNILEIQKTLEKEHFTKEHGRLKGEVKLLLRV